MQETFFLSTREIFISSDHMLGHKTSLNKFQTYIDYSL